MEVPFLIVMLTERKEIPVADQGSAMRAGILFCPVAKEDLKAAAHSCPRQLLFGGSLGSGHSRRSRHLPWRVNTTAYVGK